MGNVRAINPLNFFCLVTVAIASIIRNRKQYNNTINNPRKLSTPAGKRALAHSIFLAVCEHSRDSL